MLFLGALLHWHAFCHPALSHDWTGGSCHFMCTATYPCVRSAMGFCARRGAAVFSAYSLSEAYVALLRTRGKSSIPTRSTTRSYGMIYGTCLRRPGRFGRFGWSGVVRRLGEVPDLFFIEPYHNVIISCQGKWTFELDVLMVDMAATDCTLECILLPPKKLHMFTSLLLSS